MDKKEEIYPLYRKIVYKILYRPLYNIVVLNIQRFGVFVPKNRFRLIVRAHWRDKKIGDFSGKVDT